MIFQPQIIGKLLPALTNPGTAADLLSGKQLIDANGNVLTGTMPTQGAQTITPGATAKTIDAGRYLTGVQTIQGDTDLVPENIKSGVSIFGVSGNALTYDDAYVTGTSMERLTLKSKIPLSETKSTWFFCTGAMGSSATGKQWTIFSGTYDDFVYAIEVQKSGSDWRVFLCRLNPSIGAFSSTIAKLVSVSSDLKSITFDAGGLAFALAVSEDIPYMRIE